MKSKLLKILLALILTSLVSLSYYTHSEAFVTAGYEKIIAKECGDDFLCNMAAKIVEPKAVACMRAKFLSVSYETTKNCIQKAVDELNEGK